MKATPLFLALSLLSFGTAGTFQAQQINTFAGKTEFHINLGIDNEHAPSGADLGDGGKANAATLREPSTMVLDSAGTLYFVDAGHHRIRKITTDGLITTVAGNGKIGTPKDKTHALKSDMDPDCIALDTKGVLYISDGFNHKVYKVNADGTLLTFAGTGKEGFSGDGGPALKAQLNLPSGIATDASGSVYIADAGNCRILKIDTKGIIKTIAGTGEPESSGDGGKAISASLNFPSAITVDAKGNVYFTEPMDHKIRKINTDGTITTIAGNGKSGYSGDGGPALQASMNNPAQLCADKEGNIFVADQENSAIRKITPSGIISTIAGNGTKGFEGDGGSPLKAKLNKPAAVLVDSKGTIYIADQGNDGIRKITP
ncbi:MAG: NHL repeat-containing protein [Bacteroidia bacterium]